jgi:hypothetical protein
MAFFFLVEKNCSLHQTYLQTPEAACSAFSDTSYSDCILSKVVQHHLQTSKLSLSFTHKILNLQLEQKLLQRVIICNSMLKKAFVLLSEDQCSREGVLTVLGPTITIAITQNC